LSDLFLLGVGSHEVLFDGRLLFLAMQMQKIIEYKMKIGNFLE